MSQGHEQRKKMVLVEVSREVVMGIGPCLVSLRKELEWRYVQLEEVRQNRLGSMICLPRTLMGKVLISSRQITYALRSTSLVFVVLLLR